MKRTAAYRVVLLGIVLWGPAGGAVGAGNADRNISPTGHAPETMLGKCGGLLDIDGDGRPELLVGGPGAKAAREVGGFFVFELGDDGSPRLERVLQEGDSSGYSYAALGDADRDGTSDFAFGGVNGGTDSPLSGRVAVYRDGDLRTPVRLEGETTLDRFGFSLASGDLNADGAPDLVVGAPLYSPSSGLYQKGAVYVFFGPEFRTGDRLRLSGTAADGLGFSVATGDVNGDDIDDLLLEGTGKVLGFYGAKGEFSPTVDTPDLVVKSAATGFGRALLVAGDLDGDGCNDLAIGAYRAVVNGLAEAGSVFLVRGERGPGPRSVDLNAPSASLLARIDGPRGSQFGSSLARTADLDGDRNPELAVGAVHADAESLGRAGRVWVLKSSRLTGADPFTDTIVLDGRETDMHFGSFVATDAGGSRLLVGAPTERNNRGGFYLFNLTGQ